LNEVAVDIGYNIHCLIKRIFRNYHKTNPRKINFKNIKQYRMVAKSLTMSIANFPN
jgi:hypothetical protein